MSTRLENLLLIRAQERDDVAYFLVFFMLVSAGMAVGRGTADALFLKRLGIEYLPLMYMLQGLLLAGVSMVYAAYADRLPAERFFRVLFAALGTMVLGCWLLMNATAGGLVYPLYYLVYEVSSELLLVHAALYMNQNMHTLQAKRLSPLFYAGAQAGTILGGLLLVYGAPRLGTQNLLLAWIALLLAGIVVIGIRHHRRGPSPYFLPAVKGGGTLAESVAQVRQGIRFTYRSSLLRAASFALFFMVISFYVLCYSVNRIYTQTFESEAELTRFFGLLAAATSVIALSSQLFITNRVIRRFGIRRMNLLFPLTTLASLGALLGSFSLPVALLGSLNKDALMPAFRNPVRNMFFNVLPDYMQGRARALSVALVLPAALILCGGMLVLMQRMDEPAWFLLPGLLAGLGYLAACRRMNRAYVGTLLATLRERLFLPEAQMYADLGGSGEAVYAEVMRGVRHHDPEVSLAFSRVLAGSFPTQAAGIILERAAQGDPAAADRHLALLQDLDLSAHGAALQRLARRGDDHLRASLLRLRLDKGEPDATGEALGQLNSDNPRLRATAIHAALLPATETVDIERARSAWQALLQRDTDTRLAALSLIPDLWRLPATARAPLESAYMATFAMLLTHGNEGVRRRALLGLRAWRDALPEPVFSQLAAALDSPQAGLREAAAACLHLAPAGRREALLLRALGDGNKRIRQAAIGALRTASPDYTETALAWIRDDRGSLRAQQELLRALLQHRLPRAVFEEVARVKSHAAARLQAAARVLDREDARQRGTCYTLLRYTLQEQLEQTIETALLAMEPLYEPGLIGIIRAGFNSGDARHIANACEVLGNLPSQEIVAELGTVLLHKTGDAGSADPGVFNRLEEVLAWCAAHGNDWLSLCGSRTLQTTLPDTSRA